MANKFKASLSDDSSFIIVAELTGSPGFKLTPIENFLSAYQERGISNIPSQFNFAGIMLPQNPGGTANIEPADVIKSLKASGLAKGLEMIPHISCKDQNSDAIVSSLVSYRRSGTENILALTGDKPLEAKGVFQLDAIGLLSLVRQMNYKSYIKASPEKLDSVHQFYSGAAVSPFKYTEASQMQQYYKMEKKIASGADYLVTQVGWDWRKSLELFQYLKENDINVPVLGNVYLLSTMTPAPRLMHDVKLAGCFVSDELYEKVSAESVEQHIERAAQQVAMYKAMGAAGVDIGGVHDFDIFTDILNRAAEIGNEWESFKDNLHWPAKDAFYLYDEQGNRRPASRLKKKFGHKFFNFMHRAILDPDHTGFHAFKKTMSALGTEKGSGVMYKLFNSSEKSFKYLLFDCEECGDCYLPENFGLCTIGGCEKGMDNAPCGDSTADGYCGNNLERVCIGEYIYNAAAAEKAGLEKLRKIINKPRKPELEHTSSILNYLFAKDHTARPPLIQIAEALHASIPKTGKVMRMLAQMGPDAFEKESGPLNYIRALIESQADEGADYIDVNVDAFGEQDPELARRMMREYVRLVRKWGKGVPVCMDSSDDQTLLAGLEQWYDTDQKVAQPLLNSVKVHTVDEILPLKEKYDFAFVGLLVTEEKATGPGGSHSVEELYSVARRIFTPAVEKYGFKPEEIFFDTTVFPLAIDMPMQPDVPGYTYRTFETLRKIKTDPQMKNTHCSLGISNAVRDLPGRRIGVCRAYVAKAMEYGLDTGIVNTSHHYGMVEPDPVLVEMVDAYAKLDGSPESMNRAVEQMGKFCSENRKAVYTKPEKAQTAG